MKPLLHFKDPIETPIALQVRPTRVEGTSGDQATDDDVALERKDEFTIALETVSRGRKEVPRPPYSLLLRVEGDAQCMRQRESASTHHHPPPLVVAEREC